MEYRYLKDHEIVQAGDEFKHAGEDNWIKVESSIGRPAGSIRNLSYRRPQPAMTFDEASNAEPIHVSQEEVIHPKADDWDKAGRIEGEQIERELDSIHIVSKVSEPEEWDDGLPPIGEWFMFNAPRELCINPCKCKYVGDEWIIAETSEGHEITLQYGVLEMTFIPAKSSEQLELDNKNKAIDSALNLFDCITAPTPTQLGVLWDNGLLK